MCKTEFELTRMEVLTTFLEESICYFCGDVIHNYELVTLFDEREVIACFDCYATVEIAKTVYYCKIGGVDIQWS